MKEIFTYLFCLSEKIFSMRIMHTTKRIYEKNKSKYSKNEYERVSITV